MRTYMFYTKDGYTQDIDNNEVENMQILGFANGINENSAYDNFRKKIVLNTKYSFNEIIAQEIVGSPVYF